MQINKCISFSPRSHFPSAVYCSKCSDDYRSLSAALMLPRGDLGLARTSEWHCLPASLASSLAEHLRYPQLYFYVATEGLVEEMSRGTYHLSHSLHPPLPSQFKDTVKWFIGFCEWRCSSETSPSPGRNSACFGASSQKLPQRMAPLAAAQLTEVEGDLHFLKTSPFLCFFESLLN